MRKLINTDAEVAQKNDVVSPNSELATLVESYIENKEQESYFKDLATQENVQIKEMMHDMDITECATSLGTATITEQTRETFLEDKLIEFLKTNNVADDIVKTKEYVDFDALESAIYHETIPSELVKQMDSCKEKKTTTVLRIKKKKGD